MKQKVTGWEEEGLSKLDQDQEEDVTKRTKVGGEETEVPKLTNNNIPIAL